MFREMRRNQQGLSPEECQAVLRRGTSGVLAVAGDGGYPYAVPLSYALEGGRLFFHSARAGHKLDAIRANPKASFCVIDRDQVVPERYTTYFRSVIAFGKARVLEDEAEVRHAIEALAAKYTPDDEPGRLREIERGIPRLCMIELEIEHLTGKEAIELTREKRP